MVWSVDEEKRAKQAIIMTGLWMIKWHEFSIFYCSPRVTIVVLFAIETNQVISDCFVGSVLGYVYIVKVRRIAG